jgi:hypothetical protein
MIPEWLIIDWTTVIANIQNSVILWLLVVLRLL